MTEKELGNIIAKSWSTVYTDEFMNYDPWTEKYRGAFIHIDDTNHVVIYFENRHEWFVDSDKLTEAKEIIRNALSKEFKFVNLLIKGKRTYIKWKERSYMAVRHIEFDLR